MLLKNWQRLFRIKDIKEIKRRLKEKEQKLNKSKGREDGLKVLESFYLDRFECPPQNVFSITFKKSYCKRRAKKVA